METPGHTPEGICVQIIDTEVSDQPQKVLTGDTLFIGDVGRPDLAGAKGHTKEMMAAMMYESLHDKILKLDDAVEVYPAHGAGSMCGRNLSTEAFSTIGHQRKFNYALQPMAKEEFVKMMTTDLPEAPAYFSTDAEINRAGAAALNGLSRPLALSPSEFRKLAADDCVILDVRNAAEFGAGSYDHHGVAAGCALLSVLCLLAGWISPARRLATAVRLSSIRRLLPPSRPRACRQASTSSGNASRVSAVIGTSTG